MTHCYYGSVTWVAGEGGEGRQPPVMNCGKGEGVFAMLPNACLGVYLHTLTKYLIPCVPRRLSVVCEKVEQGWKTVCGMNEDAEA